MNAEKVFNELYGGNKLTTPEIDKMIDDICETATHTTDDIDEKNKIFESITELVFLVSKKSFNSGYKALATAIFEKIAEG